MDIPASLFLSHGPPTLPVDPSPTRNFLTRLGRERTPPRAVLVISAHYAESEPALTASPRPETIHDFRGLSQELYDLRYPAPGDPELAAEIARRLRAAGLAASLDADRGLDHGAWTPLMLMYPRAAVPVVELSLVRGEGVRYHYRLGQVLRGLWHDGVLVLGSGGISHDLRALDWGAAPSAPAYGWVSAFTDWIAERAEAGDVEALLDYRARAPNAPANHPREDHLLPFFVALGASELGRGRRIHAGVQMRALGMDAYAFD